MNVNNKVILLYLLLLLQEMASETWMAMPIFKDVTCVRMSQCDTWKCEISDLPEVLKSFQPLGAALHLTTDSDAESWYFVMLQARCPLISRILCSRSWLPYYYISSM